MRSVVVFIFHSVQKIDFAPTTICSSPLLDYLFSCFPVQISNPSDVTGRAVVVEPLFSSVYSSAFSQPVQHSPIRASDEASITRGSDDRRHSSDSNPPRASGRRRKEKQLPASVAIDLSTLPQYCGKSTISTSRSDRTSTSISPASIEPADSDSEGSSSAHSVTMSTHGCETAAPSRGAIMEGSYRYEASTVSSVDSAPPPTVLYEYLPAENMVVSVWMGKRTPATCLGNAGVHGTLCGKFLAGKNVPGGVVTGEVACGPYCVTCDPVQVAANSWPVFDADACAVIDSFSRDVKACEVCGVRLVGTVVDPTLYSTAPKPRCLLHYRPPKYKYIAAPIPTIIDIKTGAPARCAIAGCEVTALLGPAVVCPAQALYVNPCCTRHYVRFDRDTCCVVDASGWIVSCRQKGCGALLNGTKHPTHVDAVHQQLACRPFCAVHYIHSSWVFEAGAIRLGPKGTIGLCRVCRISLEGDAIEAEAAMTKPMPYCKHHIPTLSGPAVPTVSRASPLPPPSPPLPTSKGKQPSLKPLRVPQSPTSPRPSMFSPYVYPVTPYTPSPLCRPVYSPWLPPLPPTPHRAVPPWPPLPPPPPPSTS